MIDNIKTLESKVNEISISFGFREFLFPTEKLETAQRALSRFSKAMSNRIDNEELSDLTDARIKLDFVSNLIKKVNHLRFSEEKDLTKFDFLEEKSSGELLDYHKNRLYNYLNKRLPKEIKFNYTVLKNYQAFKLYYEKDAQAKVFYDKLVLANKDVFKAIKDLEQVKLDTLDEALLIKAKLTKDFPELFNFKLIEVASSTCKLNRDKIDEINKDLASKKAGVKSKRSSAGSNKGKRPRKSIMIAEKTKSKLNKVAYEDKMENNPFAAALDGLKKSK